jgi:hypothetical protein
LLSVTCRSLACSSFYRLQAQEALSAAREMSGALVKAEDELREEILRRERVRF